MNTSILEAAQKTLPNVDYIIDLYDMSFIWGSPGVLRVSGYTEEEFTKLQNLDVIDKDKMTKAQLHESALERMVNTSGTKTVYVQSKQGEKIKLELEYKCFSFEKGLYMAGKALKVTKSK